MSDFGRDLAAHIPALRAFGYRLTRNIPDSEDLAQDTMVRAWEFRSQFTPGTDLKAWLFTILRNRFYDTQKKGRGRRLVPTANIAQAVDEQRHERANQDNVVALRQVLTAYRRLTDEGREVIRLCAFDGLEYHEAADVLNVPVGTIKSRMFRARARLEARL